MAIRLPLTTVGTFTTSNEVGAGSVAGGLANTFLLPMDCDGVVVKFQASVAGTTYSTTLQTSDNGGTTWYDVARTANVSNANATTAQWISAPVFGAGQATGINQSSSILTVGIGSAAASTLGAQQNSGLPILGINARVFMQITGNATSAASNSTTTTVYVNSQSASHN